MSKREFETIEEGTTYSLPIWKVVDGKGIELTGGFANLQFVRGSKIKNEDVEKKDGILHETLLAAIIVDLKFKNNLVPSRETSLAITNLQQALHWMEERQKERGDRNVGGTYKK
jgi:hypothetical protein